MSLSLHEQLKLHIEDPLEFDNIFAHDCWTLEEYKEFFEYVNKGWLVQSGENNGFVVCQFDHQIKIDILEECDRCGFEDVSWCQSNGCDKGKRRLEWLKEEEQQLIECDFCGKEEDPDEIITGNNGKGCGECRHLCDSKKIQWSEAFCDDMTDGRCYFCNKRNNNDWDASCEDAVCIECGEKFRFDADEECYYEL